MRDGLTLSSDPFNQQTPAMHGETSVTVSHEDLRFVKTAISTMPGGLHTSADVTNVMAGYNYGASFLVKPSVYPLGRERTAG